mgnify:FL=1
MGVKLINIINKLCRYSYSRCKLVDVYRTGDNAYRVIYKNIRVKYDRGIIRLSNIVFPVVKGIESDNMPPDNFFTIHVNCLSEAIVCEDKTGKFFYMDFGG